MEEIITMAHGAGGTQTRELIEEIFAAAFDSPYLTRDDAAVLNFPGGRIAMTTDGFVVSPPFFRGGDNSVSAAPSTTLPVWARSRCG